ncbi:hypothetical protein NQZ68_011014 [Dissostichus eleginoides]|nr:hypothetical protein NQZ68_011014 [Dissostichus eleginoides]
MESLLCVWLSNTPPPPPPSTTQIRFSQITSEWLVNTACLASSANRGSGLHVASLSRVSPTGLFGQCGASSTNTWDWKAFMESFNSEA